jgi:hypothetical protein
MDFSQKLLVMRTSPEPQMAGTARVSMMASRST